MKSRYSSQSSTQGSRRGSRQRGGQGGKYSSERSSGGSKPEPASLWQKITAFFTRSKSAKPSGRPAARLAPNPSGSSSSNRDSSSPREPREPSSTREPREESRSRISRKPESVEVTTPRLYVGNLSFDATESDLSELFNGVGQVVTAEVVSHKQTQRSKGFAFVQMQTVDEAKRAVTELHDKEFLGRKLVVSGAKSSDQHDGQSEPRFTE